jgi:hypothetical protein
MRKRCWEIEPCTRMIDDECFSPCNITDAPCCKQCEIKETCNDTFWFEDYTEGCITHSFVEWEVKEDPICKHCGTCASEAGDTK